MKETHLIFLMLFCAPLSQANDCSLGKFTQLEDCIFNQALILASEQVDAQWGCWSE